MYAEMYPQAVGECGSSVCQSLAAGLVRGASSSAPSYNSLSGSAGSSSVQVSLQRASLNGLGELAKVSYIHHTCSYILSMHAHYALLRLFFLFFFVMNE